MKNNQNVLKDWLLVLLNLGLVVVGILLNKNTDSTDKLLTTISYLLIGLGCGLFGHFMGNLLKRYSTKNLEELERLIQIETNDERNLLIAEKSKAKAYDLLTYLFVAMVIILSLMGVDLVAIIMIVAVYLSIQIYALFWRSKFENTL